jgi:hypothetical protein
MNVRLLIRTGLFCASSMLVAATATAGGRPDYDNRSWFGHLDLGMIEPQSRTADILDSDWTLSGGAMFWPSEWPIGLNFDVGYSNPDFSGSAINALNDYVSQDPGTTGRIDDGDVQNWQATVNAVWGPGESGNGVYFTGGIGYYHFEATFTEVGLVYYPPVCDPWYWWCYPGGIGTGNIIRGRESTSEIGYNVGLGYSFEVGLMQMFVEATWHEIPTAESEINYIPITFGFRW